MTLRKTAYLFTGQGTQKQAMGMIGYERSIAAKDIWDRVDDFCQREMDFSILQIVKENPKTINVKGQSWSHPEGVLNLTQFTQVALVTLALAHIAELKERDLHDNNAFFAGHSLGEYAALSAEGFIDLETVARVVYHRGLTMQNFVPRDNNGSSPYRMIVIRPNMLKLSEADLIKVVETIAKKSTGALQIVNYNIRDEQYAVTGEIPLLEELKLFLQEQGEKVGMKRRCFIELPGIDVPFHSFVLRAGVDEFRKTLDNTFSRDTDLRMLEGRYIPNLNASLFSLSREYVEDVFNLTQSAILKEIIDNKDTTINSKQVARTLLIELLAYQFASPVQWIKTQEVILSNDTVEKVVEIGPSPVLSNMAKITLEKMERQLPEILHVETDRTKILGE